MEHGFIVSKFTSPHALGDIKVIIDIQNPYGPNTRITYLKKNGGKPMDVDLVNGTCRVVNGKATQFSRFRIITLALAQMCSNLIVNASAAAPDIVDAMNHAVPNMNSRQRNGGGITKDVIPPQYTRSDGYK